MKTKSTEQGPDSEGRGSIFGRYLGRLILEPLSDGRLMRLIEPFGFLDAAQNRWPVPAGAKVDGASIPRPLWSLIGGPFEGKYRNASVIHDYYCDVRTEPWRSVHRVFYDAMRTSGVSDKAAKLLYAAVYFAGPRWTLTAMENARLPRTDDPSVLFFAVHTPFRLGVFESVEVDGLSARTFLRSGKLMWPPGQKTNLDIGKMDKLIEEEEPSIVEIEEAIDEAIDVLEPDWAQTDRTRDVIYKDT